MGRTLSETLAIAGKEIRILLLSWSWNLALALMLICALAGIYQANLNYQRQVELYGQGEGPEPSSLAAFASSIWMVANAALPFLAIISGFDAITRERRAGTMQLLLTRLTSKVSIVVGKFLGGFAVVTVVCSATLLMSCGLMVALIGVFQVEELFRIVAFSATLLIYVSIWLSISLLVSTVASSRTTSFIASVLLLISLAGWSVTSAAVSSLLAPLPSFWIGGNSWYVALSDLSERVTEYLNWFSPPAVFTAAGGALLNPMVDVPPFVAQSRPPFFPVDVIETLRTIWPCISTMITMLTVTLIASYVAMRRQRIEIELGE